MSEGQSRQRRREVSVAERWCGGLRDRELVIHVDTEEGGQKREEAREGGKGKEKKGKEGI